MKAIFRFVVLILLVVGWGLAALSLHVVRTTEQIPITLVTKEKLGFTDTWVDTTTWTIDDVAKHPAVVTRLLQTHQSDVLLHVVDPKLGDVQRQLADALERAAADRKPLRDNGGQFARQIARWTWEKQF